MTTSPAGGRFAAGPVLREPLQADQRPIGAFLPEIHRDRASSMARVRPTALISTLMKPAAGRFGSRRAGLSAPSVVPIASRSGRCCCRRSTRRRDSRRAPARRRRRRRRWRTSAGSIRSPDSTTGFTAGRNVWRMRARRWLIALARNSSDGGSPNCPSATAALIMSSLIAISLCAAQNVIVRPHVAEGGVGDVRRPLRRVPGRSDPSAAGRCSAIRRNPASATREC